ncbi:MAG: 6-carboxytetrahydropterin synthase QueD [Patescibacteria group bacterium]|nr:6-carboxytetrahydropterin synthase QueD [Patescibacteria group bacterium]
MLIHKEFKFDSAHHLPDYRGKCEEVHGHTYKLRVTLEGEVQSDGLVFDFGDIEKIVQENVLEKLDHKDLNTVIENPSAEKIAIWIYDQLEDEFPEHVTLTEVRLWETATSSVTCGKQV